MAAHATGDDLRELSQPALPHRGVRAGADKLRPYALAADVAPSSVKLTSDGMRVTALAAGSYTVTVRDRSIRGGFRLVAGRFDRRTSARFRGTVTWRVRLWPYQTMKYGPLSQPLRHVEVLGDGGG